MSDNLKTVRNLKLFNRLNKSIKQGITDLQNKDSESAHNYFRLAMKTSENLAGFAGEPYAKYFVNIVEGLKKYLAEGSEDTLISTHPSSVHSQLWAVHKAICDNMGIPYVEDVDEMEAAISKLAQEGVIS